MNSPMGDRMSVMNTSHRLKFAITDYLFWLMMLFANVPSVLELIEVKTMFKPYRVLSLILATLAIPAITKEPQITKRFSKPLLFALGYLLIITVAFAGTEIFDAMIFLFSCLGIFFASYGVTNRKSLNIGLIAYVVSFLVSSYFGFLAFNSGRYRLSGLFENPNAFGYGGCFVFLILLNRYVSIPTILKFALAITVIPILVLTGSRGTLLAAAGVLISQAWRNPRIFIGLILAGIVLAIVVENFGEELAEQFGNRSVFTRFNGEILERGTEGRLSQVAAGLQVSAEHAFIGIGLGQYREQHHTRFFQRRGLDGEISKLELHNVFVSLLCEWGAVGFVAFATMIRRMFDATKYFPYERDWIYGFLGASFLNGLGNNLLGEIPFWIMLGVSVQMIRFAYMERKTNQEDSDSSGGRSIQRHTPMPQPWLN